MWQRFTENARKIVFYAQEEARMRGENAVSTEHLLLGLIRSPDNKGAMILVQLGVTLEAVRTEVEALIVQGEGKLGQNMELTPRAKRVIDLAYDEARHLRHNFIGTEHLLLGLLREQGGGGGKVLAGFGVTLEAARERLQQMQDSGAVPDEPPKPLTGLENVAIKLRAMMGGDDDKRLKETLEQEELLTLDEAVKFLGTSRPTLYRLLGQDEIKGLKVGRQWRFRKVDLVAYMERSPVAVSAAPSEDLDMELAFFAEQLGQDSPDLTGDAESKTVMLANNIIHLAINTRASDIHLEPTPDDFLLRLRVDGVLQETRRLPLRMKESLVAQFKTMAEMNLTETRLPQDGRIPIRHQDKDFEIRVASIPSFSGEALTLRILAKQDILLGLEKLGLAAGDERQLRDFMHQPNGIFLVAGPAGGGKTTLLYSCLQEAVGVEKKTLTVEDPVEYVLPYTTQTQVNKKAGLSVTTLLRAFMRQDPDVVFVSELRDLETAQLAVEVSLTGHLLLSALHTADATSALQRLLDLGLEPHLITAAVTGIAATRLIRRVCENCKQPVDLSAEPTLSYIARLAAEGGYDIPADAAFVRGVGCEQCRGRGYQGRTGLYEVLRMTEPLAEAVLRRASAEELTGIAVAGGMCTLLADGIRKAAAGVTTIEEVLRVVAVSV